MSLCNWTLRSLEPAVHLLTLTAENNLKEKSKALQHVATVGSTAASQHKSCWFNSEA